MNLVWKIAVQNVGCVFAYFCGGDKIILHYDFVALLTWKKIYVQVSAAMFSLQEF